MSRDVVLCIVHYLKKTFMNISDIHENRNENIALFKQKSETSKPYSIIYILVDQI